MKKLLTALLITAMLLSTMLFPASAASNSAWLIGEGATVTVPAELTKGYAEANSDLFSTDLSGYQYLHFKMKFAETVNVNYDTGFWFYIILTDKEEAGAWESSQNVVSKNFFGVTTYEGNEWYDITVPLAEFGAYGAGSAVIADWTKPCRMFRLVIAAAENPELQLKDIYVSVNENDPSPADAAVDSTPAPDTGATDPAPDTGSALLAVSAVVALSTAGALAVSKKKKH